MPDSRSHAQRREAALAAEAASWNTQAVRPARDGDIPIIDLAPLRRAYADSADAPSADLRKEQAQVVAALGRACREVGFYSLVGHGIAPPTIAAAFDLAKSFHAQSAEAKQALRMDAPGQPGGVGYLPPMHRKLPRRPVGNNNEAFIVKRDLGLSLSDNMWPPEPELPGFRAAMTAYAVAMEQLALSLLPLYALSLGMQADFFDEAFRHPLYRLRLTHYPVAAQSAAGESTPDGATSTANPHDQPPHGIAPHVDTTFFTLLAQDSPGLVVFSERRQCWVAVPMIEGALVVNTGELLRQWSNDEFLSVKHFADNRQATRSRYSVPFFFNATSDYPMACIPSCMGENRPAKYPTVSYADSQGVVQGE